MPPDASTSNQGRQQRSLEPVVCTQLAGESAADVCVVAGTSYRDTHSSGSQGQLWMNWQLQGPWPSACTLVAAGSYRCVHSSASWLQELGQQGAGIQLKWLVASKPRRAGQ